MRDWRDGVASAPRRRGRDGWRSAPHLGQRFPRPECVRVRRDCRLFCGAPQWALRSGADGEISGVWLCGIGASRWETSSRMFIRYLLCFTRLYLVSVNHLSVVPSLLVRNGALVFSSSPSPAAHWSDPLSRPSPERSLPARSLPADTRRRPTRVCGTCTYVQPAIGADRTGTFERLLPSIRGYQYACRFTCRWFGRVNKFKFRSALFNVTGLDG